MSNIIITELKRTKKLIRTTFQNVFAFFNSIKSKATPKNLKDAKRRIIIGIKA